MITAQPMQLKSNANINNSDTMTLYQNNYPVATRFYACLVNH